VRGSRWVGGWEGKISKAKKKEKKRKRENIATFIDHGEGIEHIR
jgi:hypothetical protein